MSRDDQKAASGQTLCTPWNAVRPHRRSMLLRWCAVEWTQCRVGVWGRVPLWLQLHIVPGALLVSSQRRQVRPDPRRGEARFTLS